MKKRPEQYERAERQPRRKRVIAEVARQLTVRGTKIYGPRGIREAYALSAIEWHEAATAARCRGTRGAPQPFTLAEVRAVQLAVLAALDGAAADIGHATRRELARARVKLDLLILSTRA